MKIRVFTPQSLLQPYIEAYSILEREANDIITDHYPTHASTMCFDITQKHLRITGHPDCNFSLGFVGIIDRYFVIESISEKILQVVFKPYGAFRFFKTKMSGFTNFGTDVRLFLPDIKDTVARMEDHYQEDAQCIAVLEDYFLHCMQKPDKESDIIDRIAYACNAIKQREGNIRIKDLCKKVNMSETRFRIHFSEKIGISPKSFCHIEKMNRVGVLLQQNKTADWIELCERLNYFDQNHFIKNFKSYFGCTPTQFLKKQSS